MKILITGAEGQLGKSLALSYPSKIKDDELTIIRANREVLDLSKESSCKNIIEKIKPDWVLNCGAYTAVDQAEREKNLAFKVNGNGPYYLAKFLKENGGKLIHISSDFVFDGKNNKPYEIDHPLNPINVYGKSKAYGEKLLMSDQNLDNFVIIRTSWVLSNTGNNFFLTMLKLISDRRLINVVNDQIGCITLVSNLSKVCWELIKLHSNNVEIPKIIHFSDSGICSWFDVARAIKEFALEKKILVNEPKIIPVSSDFFDLPAKRPNFSLLNSQKTYELINFTPAHWRKSIEILIKSLKSEF